MGIDYVDDTVFMFKSIGETKKLILSFWENFKRFKLKIG
jgi:hypothetical protein